MPRHRVPTAKSSSRSSKKSSTDLAAPGGARAEKGQRLLRLGVIVGAHALQGEVRVRADNPESTMFEPGLHVHLRRGPELRAMDIASVRRHQRMFLVRFSGVSDRTAAEGFRGYEVCVPEDWLVSDSPDEFYYHELIGMEVRTVSGDRIGRVVSVMPNPAADLLVVRDGKRECWIPMVAAFVKSIDRSARTVAVDPLPGLLDQ